MKTPSHVHTLFKTSVENEFLNDCFENKFTALHVMAALDRKEDGIRRRISLSF